MRHLFDGLDRDRQTARKLAEARLRRDQYFAWWAVSVSVAVILVGLTLALILVETLHVIRPPHY